MQAKKDVSEAVRWNELINSNQKYSKDAFEISIAHCEPPLLVRAGQHYAGDTNYWNSPEALNRAVLRVIVDSIDDIVIKAMAVLSEQESVSLKKCQCFIDDMQRKINVA